MSKIKPALTAAEWKDAYSYAGLRRQGLAPIDHVGKDLYVYALDEHGSEYGASLWGVEHAVAALALYGQPFGFTREELAYLDSFAESGFIRPIADKIRALLPPESVGEDVLK